MHPVVIVGAGICGLTAAYTLHRSGTPMVVLEAGPSPGGLIRSHQEAGYLYEAGPHTFPSTAAELMTLCREIGLSPQPAASLAKKRYLYLDGQLQALPTDPLKLITSRLLSPAGKFRLLREPWIEKNQQTDPTVAEFFTHRLGKEVTEHFVDPFISGIYAGDIHNLSLPAVFPRIWEWEQQHGSLIRGALKSRRPPNPDKPKYGLMGFSEGMQALPQALAGALPPESLRLNTPVISIESTGNSYQLKTGAGEVLNAARIILATPAYISARLLASLSPNASRLLDNVPYGPINVVHMGISRAAIPHALDGFGFLIPRKEKLPLLGTIWASALFPERAPEGNVLLSSFIGGSHHPEISDWTDEQVVQTVRDNLGKVFGTASLNPEFVHVHRYRQAIPQYTLGHQERIHQLDTALEALPGISLTGNYLSGIALNECVKNALTATKALGIPSTT